MALQALFPFEGINNLKVESKELNYKWKANDITFRSRFTPQQLLTQNGYCIVYAGYNRKDAAEIAIRYDDGEPAGDEQAFLLAYMELLHGVFDQQKKKKGKTHAHHHNKNR